MRVVRSDGDPRFLQRPYLNSLRRDMAATRGLIDSRLPVQLLLRARTMGTVCIGRRCGASSSIERSFAWCLVNSGGFGRPSRCLTKSSSLAARGVMNPVQDEANIPARRLCHTFRESVRHEVPADGIREQHTGEDRGCGSRVKIRRQEVVAARPTQIVTEEPRCMGRDGGSFCHDVRPVGNFAH